MPHGLCSFQVCLKRALKIANAAQQQLAVAARVGVTQPVWLFMEILNHYLYYYDQGNPNITASVLQVRLRTRFLGVILRFFIQLIKSPNAAQCRACWNWWPMKWGMMHACKTRD
jgi:hypothetical protein